MYRKCKAYKHLLLANNNDKNQNNFKLNILYIFSYILYYLYFIHKYYIVIFINYFLA